MQCHLEQQNSSYNKYYRVNFGGLDLNCFIQLNINSIDALEPVSQMKMSWYAVSITASHGN